MLCPYAELSGSQRVEWMTFIKGIFSRTSGFKIGILLVAAAVLFAACGGEPPRIEVEPAAHDLGERAQEPIELFYTVHNVGGKPLRIEKVSTSCGCTRASIDREIIPPGESAQLRVTFDPTENNLYGNLLRVIYIRSNDPDHPEVEVEFRVTIRKPEDAGS
jgi:hypothetical protein